jgi:hypothetical protein
MAQTRMLRILTAGLDCMWRLYVCSRSLSRSVTTELGADVNLRDRGRTPLQVALQKGSSQAAGLLFEQGAERA